MVSGSSDRTNPSGSLRGRQLGKVVEADISVLRQTLLVLQEGALPDWLSPVITTVSMSANASRTSRPSERGWYAVRMQNQIAAFRQTFRFEKGADVEAAVGQLHPTRITKLTARCSLRSISRCAPSRSPQAPVSGFAPIQDQKNAFMKAVERLKEITQALNSTADSKKPSAS